MSRMKEFGRDDLSELLERGGKGRKGGCSRLGMRLGHWCEELRGR